MKQRNPVTKERRKSGRKVLAAVLSLAMILTLANPTTVFAAEKDGTEQSGGFWSNAIESIADFFGCGGDDAADAGVQTRAATTNATLTADGDTKDAYSIGDETSTRYNGRVWVDKSVSADSSVSFGDNLEVDNNSDFLITYSALATSTNIIGQTPTDTVFILDLSASMTWGYRDSGQSVPQDESRLQAMVDSMNSAIDTLVKANPQNRIAIVTFNGSCQAEQALIPDLMTGEEILAEVTDGKYLEIQNYDQNLNEGEDDATADVYCYATRRKASTSGGTNIQAGLFRGMSILANTPDTTADVNGTTVTRVPNVILMSDGAPTTFSSSENASYVYYRYDGEQEHENGTRVTGIITNESGVLREGDNDVYSGDWWETNSGEAIGAGNNNDPDSADGFMALLTASYFKNAISNNYYPDSNKEANVYTIGFGTEVQDADMVAMANLVLDPGENLGVNTNYDQVDKVSTAWETYQEGKTPTVHAPIGDGKSSLDIPFVVSQCAESENNPTSLDYPTRYYAAADDEDLNQIFTEIASLITSQASAPTEVTGDPLDDGYITYTDTTGKYMEIKDVTTLIFMDQKLDVTKDNSQSNDTVTTYVADGYEYENPAYPGGSYNTNQIKITVTDNADSTQTIKVEIPAALIPLRVNTITLNGNGEPTNSTSTGNLPLRLCYEVGLEDGINTTTLEGVDESYISANTENGKVNFYSNAYDANSDAADKGVGATVTFEAAPTNPFYFVQEDTPLYLLTGMGADGSSTYERATGTFDENTTYYFPVIYYTGEGEDVQEETTYVARSGATLADYVDADAEGWYIISGSPRIGNLEDVTAAKDTENNKTGTYGNYREPTFVYDDDSNQNPQEGHFLVLLGNNGKLSLPFMNKDVSLTNDSTHASIDGQMVGIGEKLHYTITWVNTAVDQDGDPVAATVEVVDTLPDGTHIEDADIPEGATYDAEAGTITWEIEAAAGDSGTVEFDVVVDAEAVENVSDGTDGVDAETENALPNTATITIGNNSYTTNTTVNYVPEKSVTMPGASGEAVDADGETVEPGTQLTYTIEYRNTESTESTVTITDAVPDETTFVSASPAVVPDQDGNLTWTVDNVAAGATGSVSFTVVVDNSAVTTIENEANVKVGDHNPVVTNEVTTNVNRASLIIAKEVTADQGLTAPDKEFSFELTIASKAGEQNVAATIHTEGADDSSTSLNFDADGKTTFTLKADQSLEISGLGNVQYSVVEQNAANGEVNDGFTLSKVEGASSTNDKASATAAGTVGNSNATVTFTNNYTATFDNSTSISLSGTKNLDVGDGLTYELKDGDFTFTVTALDGAPGAPDSSIGNANSAQVADSNDWTSSIALLSNLTFSASDMDGSASKTFSYIITEDLPSGVNADSPTANGITYDTSAYKVDITVIDNREGTLSAGTPVIAKGTWNDSVFTADDDQTGVSGVVFTNSYEPAEITLSGDSALTVNKNVVGADTDADFSFTATFNAEESAAQDPAGSASGIKGYSDTFELTGNVSESFTAGETKSVSLSEVTFTRPGTYVFDVNEDQTEAPEGWSYDNTTRQIVVKIVERNGALAVDGEIAAPTFTNIYFNYGDAKDVFATDVDGNKTGSSIDGQLVGIGDTLTYEITWTNTKSEAVNVVVTDTIPTGTQIAVNADSNNIISDGGVLDNGVITWNLGQKEAGESGTVSFAVVVTEDALDITAPENTVTNQATITIGEGASQVELITNRTENPVPEKSVTDNDTSTDGTQVGDTLTYTIQYANAGDEPVDMVITDTLSKGLTYVPDSAGANAEYDADSRTITWTLTDVPAGTMDGQVTFQAVVNENAAGQTIENEAKITVGHDPQITTNKTETEVKTGSLMISKTITVNEGQGTVIDTTKAFTFTVVLTDKKGTPLDGEYSYNGTSDGTTEYQGTITSGGTITLKHNGSVTITGLPEGAKYTVTETPEAGYTAQNAELKGNIPAGSAATAAFVNNYSAGQATLSGETNLEVTKEFTGKDWGDEVFTFTLTQKDGDTTKVTLPDNADSLQIGKDTPEHKAAFGDIIFTAAGEYTFEISEKIPENPGQIQYDNHKVTITVNVTDNKSGDLVASVASATTSGSMTFKNTYIPQSITANIQALKDMTGRDLRDTDKFTFTIKPQDGAPATTKSEVENGGQDNTVIDFGYATFTKAGTYTYLITETGGSVAGVTNSTQKITATVQVDYNEATGTLSSVVSYSGGDGDAHNTFTNVYKADPVIPAEFTTGITGTKTVTASEGNSYTMKGGEFSFTLTPSASNPSTDPVEATTITNEADGSLVFVQGPVTYTESGTYTYTIKENDSSVGGITEAGSQYTIVVEVTDSGDGQLAADVSITKDGNAADEITFDNSYDPAKTGVAISGTKELTGKNIENNMFTFQITGENGAPMPSATKVQNTGSSFAFGTIEYTEPGTYVYHISEVNDGKTGYTYDDTEYDVTVVVKDKDGVLEAEVSGADAIVFKNSYTPNPVILTGETALKAHKTLTGRGLNAEEFVFEVKDADGNVLTTGTNDADGNVVFGDLTFDQTGTYNYTISEKNNSLGGITYDGTIYTVQIDVTDAGGYLEAAVQYFEGNTKAELLEFENKYTAASTGVSLGASKILTGRDLKDGEFAFVLKDADGNTVDEAVNDANGSVKFDEITYDQAGTYRYTVAEVKGDDTAVTYDETVYDVTVEVTDNGIGALEPTVTIGNGEHQGIVFTNEYNEPENPTPDGEDTPDDKTPDKKPDNGGTTQSTDKENVQTGDTAQFIPVVAALLASLLAVIAIAVIMIRRRRR